MELILDTGNIEEIKEYDQFLNVSGVTTNPTIITKSGKSPEAVISDLVDYLRADQKIFIQVVATDFEGIMEEARYIASLRPENMYVKIPVHRAGLQAVKACHEEGIHTLATAIYSADSGFMAAVNGADYLAPYVNRMSNYGDGVAETIDLIEMLRVQNASTKVVAASFHSVNQVHQLIRAGIQAITVPPSVLKNIVDNPHTTIAVDEFTANWKAAYGRTTLTA